ncbi:hypothetical protein AQUCO_00400590v1 [Aquilegia coerulea]|uniref:Calponin-homology (CH) domain-containing protein n=1 Tax=Aquilegia coerulea TaxID=218851 RepID=A0A2G5EVL4_AQUCA|nr:hypothetical protein AQUCO_00400590v1 [Aquilegia coerulea]
MGREGGVVARADSTGLHKLQIESFPFSAESSFREHDHVFLQTQTRIWLGEMLKTRLDEEISIADLLADGLLLFEVSKVIWKMLLTKFMKLRSSKAYFSKSASGKKGGRYMPYSNVDSFLKICQVLGLTSIDLFSPSDVVEKRDIRRVCMCIRSLSKKARSKDLNVPDFDVVTYTVAMPKDMVKGIRNSLEQSQCRLSEDSPVCSTYIGSRPKYGKKNWVADFARHYDSCSEESDTTDSNYQVVGFNSPASTTSCSCASLSYSDLESSPRGSYMAVEDFHLTHCMLQTDGRAEEIDWHTNGSYCSPLDVKGSLNAYHQLNDNHRFTDTMLDGRLSPSCDGPTELNSGINGNKEAVREALSTNEDDFSRNSKLTLELEACASLGGNSVNWYKPKQDVIQSGTSEINTYGTDIDELMVFSRLGKIVGIDSHKETDFYGSESIYKTAMRHHRKRSFEVADISLAAFSNLGKADATYCEDTFVGKEAYSNPNIQIPQKLQKSFENHIIPVDRPLDTDELQIHLKLKEVDSTKECELTTRSNENDLKVSGSSIINQQCLDEHDLKSAHQACTNHEDASHSTENLDKEIRCEQVGKNVGASDRKRNKKLLLKSFAGGMSLFGMLMLIFHLRRPNGGEKTNKTSVLPIHIRKTNNRETSEMNREQRNKTSGVYPAEKLRF